MDSRQAEEAMETQHHRELAASLLLKRGHFAYESGHHGDLWLELDTLFKEPARTDRWIGSLCEAVSHLDFDLVCGPLVGGALVGYAMATHMGKGCVYSERHVLTEGKASYVLPPVQRAFVAQKKVLLVDDAINAGSAVRATHYELDRFGASTVGLAAFLTLGSARERMSAEFGAPCISLLDMDRQMWPGDACPLCEAGVPIDTV